MLLYDLLEKCSYRDEFQRKHEQCVDCSYGKSCPRNCQRCLQYVHFPNSAPEPRKYDCPHMADCYYCKYAYRYGTYMYIRLKQRKMIIIKGKQLKKNGKISIRQLMSM